MSIPPKTEDAEDVRTEATADAVQEAANAVGDAADELVSDLAEQAEQGELSEEELWTQTPQAQALRAIQSQLEEISLRLNQQANPTLAESMEEAAEEVADLNAEQMENSSEEADSVLTVELAEGVDHQEAATEAAPSKKGRKRKLRLRK